MFKQILGFCKFFKNIYRYGTESIFVEDELATETQVPTVEALVWPILSYLASGQ